jgi:hypothetical protein
MGLSCSALAGATLVWYLTLIASEPGPEDLSRVVLVSVTIGAASLAAAVGSVAAGDLRVTALSAATGTLLALGYLAIFSIGFVLIIAGLLAGVAAAMEVRRYGGIGRAALGGLLGAGAALVPFALIALSG